MPTPTDRHHREPPTVVPAGGRIVPNACFPKVGHPTMKMWRCAAAAAAAGFLVGCGESGPKLVPVSGTVTLNGKPLEGAAVAFQPDASLQGGLPAGEPEPSGDAMPSVMPQMPVHRDAPKVGRNDPCPCGSGKKYKKCHGAVVV